MKTNLPFRLMLAPVLAAGFLFFTSGINTPAAAQRNNNNATAYNVKGNGDKKAANDEKVVKTQKRKRVKYQRTNHGPKKPIFPQLHRKEESLNRANHRDPFMHFRH